MKAPLCLAVLFLVVCTAVTDLIAQPRGKSRPKLRVVIDASHDGGAWWFPQGPAPFDSQKPHQGAALAYYLKSRGWEVIEVPRGTKITNQFEGATIVVRMGAWDATGTTDSSEVAAYRQFVSNGGRLLLAQGFVRAGEAENNTLAKQFAIRFEGLVEEPLMRAADPRNFTRDFNDALYRIGSVVVKYPDSTRPLAYLNDNRLVMGMARFGRGLIIFISSVFPVLEVTPPFTTRLFDELARPRFRPMRSQVSKPLEPRPRRRVRVVLE